MKAQDKRIAASIKGQKNKQSTNIVKRLKEKLGSKRIQEKNNEKETVIIDKVTRTTVEDVRPVVESDSQVRSRDTGEAIQKRIRQAESAAKSEDIETVNESLLWLSCMLSVLLLLFGVSYWFYWKDVVGMRVMALNTWCMPHTLG